MKATYRESDRPIEAFSSVIGQVKQNLLRPEIPNTAFDVVIKGDTLLDHLVRTSPNRILNPLFTFMVFIDADDLEMAKLKDFIGSTEDKVLPNVIVFLRAGIVFAGAIADGGLTINRYPEHHPERGLEWHFSKIPGPAGSLPEGNHLAFLYYTLILHLAESHIDNTFTADYFNPVLSFPKNAIKILGKSKQDAGANSAPPSS